MGIRLDCDVLCVVSGDESEDNELCTVLMLEIEELCDISTAVERDSSDVPVFVDKELDDEESSDVTIFMDKELVAVLLFSDEESSDASVTVDEISTDVSLFVNDELSTDVSVFVDSES